MVQATPGARPKASANAVLAMLMLVYTFNFLDRQILAILAEPVKRDLGLSDTQMGALGGIAFALFYSTMAIPIGLLADRRGRAKVIGISLLIWSGFTALCGLAQNFAQMFLYRLGVGVGEAGGVAPSYAIIADRFPPERRARALAIYSLGIPLGQGFGALFGTMLAAALDWRWTFLILGIAGILVWFPYRRVVRDEDSATPLHASEATPLVAVFRRLAHQPVFWLLGFGAAAGSFCGYGIAFWMPAFIQRSFGLTLVETGQLLGAQILVSGIAGVYAGGWLGDRLGHGDKAGYARVAAIAYALSAVLLALAFTSGSAWWFFVMVLVPGGLISVWIAPVMTTVQHLVPATDRATASACFLLINNGIGLGFGSLGVGFLSDNLAPVYGGDALRYALIATSLLYCIAAAAMLAAAPRLRKAWIA